MCAPRSDPDQRTCWCTTLTGVQLIWKPVPETTSSLPAGWRCSQTRSACTCSWSMCRAASSSSAYARCLRPQPPARQLGVRAVQAPAGLSWEVVLPPAATHACGPLARAKLSCQLHADAVSRCVSAPHLPAPCSHQLQCAAAHHAYTGGKAVPGARRPGGGWGLRRRASTRRASRWRSTTCTRAVCSTGVRQAFRSPRVLPGALNMHSRWPIQFSQNAERALSLLLCTEAAFSVGHHH